MFDFDFKCEKIRTESCTYACYELIVNTVKLPELLFW